MQLLPLTQLMTTLKMACPAADTYSAAPASYAPAAAAGNTGGNSKGTSAAVGGSSSNASSLAAHNKFIDSFPGPLNSSSNKDKVLKFLKDRVANYVQEEGLTDAPSWQVSCFWMDGWMDGMLLIRLLCGMRFAVSERGCGPSMSTSFGCDRYHDSAGWCTSTSAVSGSMQHMNSACMWICCTSCLFVVLTLSY